MEGITIIPEVEVAGAAVEVAGLAVAGVEGTGIEVMIGVEVVPGVLFGDLDLFGVPVGVEVAGADGDGDIRIPTLSLSTNLGERTSTLIAANDAAAVFTLAVASAGYHHLFRETQARDMQIAPLIQPATAISFALGVSFPSFCLFFSWLSPMSMRLGP